MRKFVGCLAILLLSTVPALANHAKSKHKATKPATSKPAARPAQAVHLIPQPVSLQTSPGVFTLNPLTTIVLPVDTPEVRRTAEYLQKAIEVPTGYKLKIITGVIQSTSHGVIVLSLVAGKAAGQPEGYELKMRPNVASVQASAPAGIFYGVQTLLQLFPPEIASPHKASAEWTAPCVQIVDYPRFAWRGVMLDVSRHFFGKEYVERYLDQMARYKFNVFHWHLTDDNGWRIEIKSLPQLTKVGAWRVPRLAKWGTAEPPREGEPATVGGFYTQDEIREVIAYAKDRYITVLPEIEMPGHSMAAVASYPELSCTGGPFQVNPGSPYYGKIDNNLCPGNEQTFEFLDKVLTEVAALFPSEYIHVGGDECLKTFWHACPKCQKRMKDEHLANEEELQSYLIRRAEKIVESKGKHLIGWDEILEGGLAPNATVMSWRGFEGGIAAAKQKHKVVMSPVSYSYIDYYQGDPLLEPRTFGYLTVSKAYQFEPVPEGVDPAYILGAQANLWTESVPTGRHAEYMTWPRALALSEAFWSKKEARNWDAFVPRMEAHFERLDAAEVNYSRAVYDVEITPEKDARNGMVLLMGTELNGCEIYYTFDGTTPDNFSPKFTGTALPIPGDADLVRAIAYRNGRPSGRVLSVPVKTLQERLKGE
ncbi:MAG: family 20 glycosylhydrolase [Bryobacteraceae bacterium]|nr:family 20 glycosylhydrolase [Bryobacteraceae bacterium]